MKLSQGAPVEHLLREATDAGLLTTYAALTHRIGRAQVGALHSAYRSQRGLVESEILRRMSHAH